jgi:hypothetical protein
VLADLPAVNSQPEEDALAELAQRYLKGYGPAGEADFARWAGLPAADAKKGWELLRRRGLLADVNVGGRALGIPEAELESIEKQVTSDTTVNLLPAFDTLVLGYADRELIVPAKHYRDVYHGGQTVPVVLVDGEAAGVWRYRVNGRRINLEVRPFGTLDGRAKALVEDEAEDIGRFFGLAPTIKWHSG